jgi:hypothetical protein
MEQYYILRKNQESGPFTLKELKVMGLFADDLVWIEEESTCWKNPGEIEALKGLIKEAEKKPASIAKSRTIFQQDEVSANQFSSSNQVLSTAETASIYDEYLQEEAILSTPSFEALKQKHSETPRRTRLWRQSVNFGANLFGLTVLVMGVMVVAVMVKKAVDSLDLEPVEETAEAHAIESEKLPPSNTTHLAAATLSQPVAQSSLSMPAPVQKNELSEKANLQNKIREQLHPHDASVTKPTVDKLSADTESANQSIAPKNESNTADAIPVSNNEDKPAEEVKQEKNVSKAPLKVSANDYSVGLFGGISNLELTVSNPSSVNVDKALVEVDYLKPNGKVANSQTIEVTDLTAGATKKISVPNSSRGVRIRYHVVDL